MGQALYRKYRSRSLEEIVGQEHITVTLSNALKSGKVSHAYLFTGPRGVGKTSIARILAYAVNDLAYDEGSNHLDIIEIDAASNRRIDEIRELREKVHTAPTSAKYKVYIIDEVHMLTREAFNALLKTLEEPPAHAIFILATTDAHKVPDTITSRTQRFAFRPIGVGQQVEHLRLIAEKEKVKIDDDALELIARHSSGSFRDSISLLDQVRTAGDRVTLEAVQSVLGLAPAEVIEELANRVNQGTAAEILNYLMGTRQKGYQATQLATQMSALLRERFMSSNSLEERARISTLLYKLLGVAASHDPTSLFELILLEAATTTDMNQSPDQKTAPTSISTSKKVVTKAETTPASSAAAPNKETAPKVQSATNHTSSALDTDSWHRVLQALKEKHTTLYGIARMAVPSFAADEVTLSFNFPFHQKRFNEPKTRQLISDIILAHTGQKVTITCVVNKVSNKPESTITKDGDVLTNISNIFGDAEVLE